MIAPTARPGDRVPEFLLPAERGIAASFSERYCGRPAVIVLAPSPQALDGYLRLATRARLLGLVPGPRGRAVNAAIPAMCDDGLLARALFGCSMAPGQRILAWVVDATGCLATFVDDADPIRLAAAVDALPALVDPGTLSAVAPVLILPGVLDAALCDALIAAHVGDHAASGMVRVVDGASVLVPDPAVKRRTDHRLVDPALTAAVQDAVARRLLPALATAFNAMITSMEGFKVVRYDGDSDGFFGPHRDNLASGTRHRKFALSINLNDDYEGGGLLFPEFGPARYRPPRGGAIAFSGGLLHAATEVTRGWRYVLLTFLW